MKSRLVLLAPLILHAAACYADDLDKALKTIKSLDLQKHQMVIASDDFEGRECGSEGGHKAALYIAEQLGRLGLEPGGDGGTWFQPFGENQRFEDLAESNVLKLFRDQGLRSSDLYRLNEGMIPVRTSRAGTVAGTIVFAGYGITSPEHGYDDYQSLKVKDCIVLVLDHEPQEKDPASAWAGEKPTACSSWDHKIEAAQKNGAAALLIVLDPVHHAERGIPKDERLSWPAKPEEAKASIPVAYISREAAEAIAKSAGRDLKKLQEEIDRDGKPRNFKTTRTASLSVAHRGLPRGSKNIVALKRGSDPKLREEVVVIGAHYDHVGRGRFGTRGKENQIHNGADDNASGTSVLLEIAEALVLLEPRRSVVCVWFDGEEKGLLGSKAWVQRPSFPMANVMAMINLDMVGRNDLREIRVGLEQVNKASRYPKFAGVVREAEKAFKIPFDWNYIEGQGLMQRSDQWSFAEAGVPAIFFTGGLHADYHTERDDADRINYPKEETIGRIALWLAMKLAGMDGGVR